MLFKAIKRRTGAGRFAVKIAALPNGCEICILYAKCDDCAPDEALPAFPLRTGKRPYGGQGKTLAGVEIYS